MVRRPPGEEYRSQVQVLYEMHVGTFTPEGNWEAARAKLPELREVGVTTVRGHAGCGFRGQRSDGAMTA